MIAAAEPIYVTTISDIQAKRERINEFVQETLMAMFSYATLINTIKLFAKGLGPPIQQSQKA